MGELLGDDLGIIWIWYYDEAARQWLQLGANDPRFAEEQSSAHLPREFAQILHGQTLYTNMVVLPALMLEVGPPLGSPRYDQWRKALDNGSKKEPNPMPVKTLPSHFAQAWLAAGEDIAAIFGKPEQEGNFIIGSTREQGHPVCINLDRFIQRSSGIFGATGTGKSFLTRIILAGLIDTKRDRERGRIIDIHVIHDSNVIVIRELVLNTRVEENGWVDYLDGILVIHENEKLALRWRRFHATKTLSS